MNATWIEKEEKMFRTSNVMVGLLVVAFLAWALPVPSHVQAADPDAVNKAFEALKTYDWGSDRAPLQALDQAVAASHKDASAQRELEKRLAAVLSSDAPNAAKDVACRQLSLIGSADSVPTIAALLTDKELSHMARYALERMPCPEAVKAMRDAVPKTEGLLKVGVINSLGVRRDAESVGTMVKLLDDSDPEIVAAAAAALGSIGNSEAAKALSAFQKKAPEPLQLPAADAYLTCAERLLADGKKAEAMLIYKALSKAEQKHVRLAAVRGMLAVTGQK
jgi:HEAT repeat protein